MRHRVPVAAATLLCLLTTSAFAEVPTREQMDAGIAAVAEADLSDEAYRNMWCGAAFGVVKDAMTQEGNTVDAEALGPLQDAVFQKAATELIAEGVTKEQFEKLAENFYYVVMSQTENGGAEAEYSQEDCTAAAQP